MPRCWAVEPAIGRAHAALVNAGVDVWSPQQAAAAFEEEVSTPSATLGKRKGMCSSEALS